MTFQLCRDPLACAKILDSWSLLNVVSASWNLGADFLFISLYPLTIGLGVIAIATSSRSEPLFCGVPFAVLLFLTRGLAGSETPFSAPLGLSLAGSRW